MSELSKNWGNFTVKGSAEFESHLSEMMAYVASQLDDFLQKQEYRALVLLGGYGRGEGGVLVEDNQEKPHNNFDLILFTTDIPQLRLNELQEELDAKVAGISDEIGGIPIDISVMLASKLASSTGLIIWYDMRYGHKTILGDSQFVPSMKKFDLDSIPGWDARNLLINRGSLLLINDLLLENDNIDEKEKRLVIKHAIKAIIGYGDALLFFHNRYNWSYVEKLKRIEELENIDEEFRSLYTMAANFRYQADYRPYLNIDLKDWMDKLRPTLAPVMLECERRRLHQKDLNWSQYPATAFSFALTDDMSLKGVVKKLRNFLRNKSDQRTSSLQENFGFKCLNKAGQLAVFFPLVAYKIEEEDFIDRAAQFFNENNKSIPALRNAYLRYWGEHVDINFKHVVKKYGLEL